MLLVGMVIVLSGCASQEWVADWKDASPLNVQRSGAASAIVKDRIYVIGGANAAGSLKSTEYAQIQKDGSLARWQRGPELNEERSYMDAVVHGDSIYVAGGANGFSGAHLLRTVERARILPDGSLGPWE